MTLPEGFRKIFGLKIFYILISSILISNILISPVLAQITSLSSLATYTGENNSDRFGFIVSSAGDINNDGYDDIIVGAYGYDASKGRVYIFYGGSSITRVLCQ